MKNDKLRDYLLGGNDKLIGSIIGFSKGLKFNKWVKWNNNNSKIFKGDKNELNYLPEGYAILLYFYHRTGKIERHLYNPNLTFWGKKPLVIDYTQNILQSRSTNYINPYVFNHDPDVSNIKSVCRLDFELVRPLIEIDDQEFKNHPILRDQPYDTSFKNLYDGKLTRYMYNLFIIELVRDYMLNLDKNIEKVNLMKKELLYKESITDMLKLRLENEQKN
jgi:hypothetical protein